MSGRLFVKPSIVPVDSSGRPLANATYTFYISGTTTLAPIYADAALSATLDNPVSADASGTFPPIWLSSAITYRSKLETSGGASVEDVDPYPAYLIQTASAAEVSAAVTPDNFDYVEGDIRRYGALTSAVDNSTAFNNALTVSSYSGAAVQVPPGTWVITASLVAPPGSSMSGHGKSSIIQVANGIDGIKFTTSDAGIVAQPRFFRDFQILGTLSGTTNNAHGIYINTTTIDHVNFDNIAIFNFQYGMYVQGLYYSTIQNCWIQNCYQGIYFNNQSVNIYLQNNTIQKTSAGTLITATGTSKGISVQGAPEIEGLHIQGGSLYGYDYGMFFGLIFECQIEAVDISYCVMCPIFFSTTIGGLVIRDCWVELAASASGTWNTLGTGTGNLTGIFVAAITPSVNSKVHIHGNYIIHNVTGATIAGSTGVYLGNSNVGLTLHDNHILNFDVGIGGGNTLINTGTFTNGISIKYNTINVVKDTTSAGVYSTSTSVMNINSFSSDVEIGPNYIVKGTGAAATIAGTATITVPSQATTGNQQFPVGTPVQCTSSLSGGPVAGVTYYVIASSTTSVTIGPTAGASAITWGGTGSIGSLVQAPDPVNYTSVAPTGTSFFARGAFQLGLTGASGATGTVNWFANGHSIVLTVPSTGILGASTTTAMTATGLPPYLWPITTRLVTLRLQDNNVNVHGALSITSAGVMTFLADITGSPFTNANNKGIVDQIRYELV